MTSMLHSWRSQVFVSLARGGDEHTRGLRAKKDLFKAALQLSEPDWAPGKSFPFIARDGVEYVVPPELLPSTKAWKKMSGGGGVVMHEVRLERKQRNLAKLLAATPGTRLVRLFKAKRTDVVGVSLSGTPEEHPIVVGISQNGLLSKSRRLFVGDELMAINGVPTRGHEATRLRLSSGVGELYLSIRRSGDVHGDRDRQSTSGSAQLIALLGRTLRVQGRQQLQVYLALLVPLTCILILVLVLGTVSSDQGAHLKALLQKLQIEAHQGCANVTQLLGLACELRAPTAQVGNSWYPAEDKEITFTPTISGISGARRLFGNMGEDAYNLDPDDAPGGAENLPGSGNHVGCKFCVPSEDCATEEGRAAQPDRCTSSFIGGANPNFHNLCANMTQFSSRPNMTEQIPEWCNCSSLAFITLAQQSPLCTLERTTLGELYVDPNPVPSLRMAGSGDSRGAAVYAYRDQSGAQHVSMDRWVDYAAWRVPIIPLGNLIADFSVQPNYHRSNGLLYDSGCALGAPLDTNGFTLPQGRVDLASFESHVIQSGINSTHSACLATPVYNVTTDLTLNQLSANILSRQLAVRDSLALPPPLEPLIEGAESHELEQLFPSIAVEVHNLSTTELRSLITLTSFWGGADDWPYVRAPATWPTRPAEHAFKIVKFREGNGAGQRLPDGGGIGAVIQNFWVNALLRSGVSSNASIRVAFKSFPYERTGPDLLRKRGINPEQSDPQVLAFLVDAAVPLATSFALPLVISTVVIEKEHKLRALMVMMGLRMRWYWLCEWLWNSALVTTINLALFSAGSVGGLEFVTRSSSVFLCLLLLWGQCMVATGALLSTLYSRLLASTVITYFVVIACTLLSIVLNHIIYAVQPTSPQAQTASAYPTILNLIAPMAYYRAVHLLYERPYTIDTVLAGDGDGEMVNIIWMLVLDALAYGLVAAYLDAVLPREFGVAYPPLFFLQPIRPSFKRVDGWLRTCAHNLQGRPAQQARVRDTGHATATTKTAQTLQGSDAASSHLAKVDSADGIWFQSVYGERWVEDVDVNRERCDVERAAAYHRRASTAHHGKGAEEEIANSSPIEMLSLRKMYGGGKVAVRDLTLSIHENECFGLLGPNGAGKTSTIAMLTGLYPPSGGKIFIFGFDAATSMHRIYESMGICPQFDILWPQLTVLEHLRFYLSLKGYSAEEVADRAVASAVAVELDHAANRHVSRLSGGMKRRVSLAISLLAEPTVIFLDEPTTGLDPETRRSMWTLIDVAKKGRSIVLTTHSMEEADALCQRIGIMAYGTLRCLGPSLHLKRRFGDGFRIDVTYAENGAESARAFLTQVLAHSRRRARDDHAEVGTRESSDSAELNGEGVYVGANTIVLLLPHGSVRLADLFACMGARPDEAQIVHWSLRQPSLEEVFLNLTADAEHQNRQNGNESAVAMAHTSALALQPDAAASPGPAAAARTKLKTPMEV